MSLVPQSSSRSLSIPHIPFSERNCPSALTSLDKQHFFATQNRESIGRSHLGAPARKIEQESSRLSELIDHTARSKLSCLGAVAIGSAASLATQSPLPLIVAASTCITPVEAKSTESGSDTGESTHSGTLDIPKIISFTEASNNIQDKKNAFLALCSALKNTGRKEKELYVSTTSLLQNAFAALADSNPELRKSAIICLGCLGGSAKSATPHLNQIAQRDAQADVVRLAYQTLQILKSHEESNSSREWKLDLATQVQKFDFYVPSRSSSPKSESIQFLNGDLCIKTSASIVLLDPKGTLKWSTHATGGKEFLFDPIFHNGNVYITTDSKRTSSLHLFSSDGIKKWTVEQEKPLYDTGVYIPMRSLLVDHEGTAYFINHRELKAIRPDGTEKWSVSNLHDMYYSMLQSTENPIKSLHIISSIWNFASQDYYHIRINTQDGSIAEKVKIAEIPRNYQLQFDHFSNGILTLGRGFKNFCHYSLKTGALTKYVQAQFSNLGIPSGHLFSVDHNNQQYLINYHGFVDVDHKVEWSHGNQGEGISQAIASGDTMYLKTVKLAVPDQNKQFSRIYAVSLIDGKEKWKFDVPNGTNLIGVDPAGVIYTSLGINQQYKSETMDPKDSRWRSDGLGITLINPDGTIKKSFTHSTKDAVLYKLGDDGIVYVLGSDKTFSAIDTKINYPSSFDL